MKEHRDTTTISRAGGTVSSTELRAALAMVVPVVITTSSRAMMDVADYVMITVSGSTIAQAAILPAQMVMFTYLVLGMGVVSIVSTFSSQSLGRGDLRSCGAYAWQVVYISLFFGLIAAAMIPGLPALIDWIGHDPEVRALELAYSRVALLTAFPSAAAAGLGQYFIGIHRPRITMWTALEANVVNVVVSVVLIFGYLGFAPMGIAGAAWGTLAGVSYRAIRLAAALLTPTMEREFASRSSWAPSIRKLAAMFRVGLPCGLHWLSEVVVWALFVNKLIGTRFGIAHLVATNTAWQFMRVAFMPTLGVGIALTSMVGKSIGAGLPDRARRQTRLVLYVTAGFMGLLSTIYLVFGGRLIGWFNPDPEVIRIGAMIMACAAVFQLFDAVGITYSAALRGAGDTFWPAVVFATSGWLIIIGGGSLAANWYPEWGSLGPWLAASTLIILTAGYLWRRWQSGVWMEIQLIDPDSTNETAGEKPVGRSNLVPVVAGAKRPTEP